MPPMTDRLEIRFHGIERATRPSNLVTRRSPDSTAADVSGTEPFALEAPIAAASVNVTTVGADLRRIHPAIGAEASRIAASIVGLSDGSATRRSVSSPIKRVR